MKTKIIIISLISCLCVMSCRPKFINVNVQEYVDTLKLYYPYSVGEKFIFMNDELGLTWEAKACDERGSFPHTTMDYPEKDIRSKSYNVWGAYINADIVEKDLTPDNKNRNHIRTDIEGNGTKAYVVWFVKILIYNEELATSKGFMCDYNEVFSLLTDTILLPASSPEGSYARIVKYQGLTDFSVDGKTVWKRVK